MHPDGDLVTALDELRSFLVGEPNGELLETFKNQKELAGYVAKQAKLSVTGAESALSRLFTDGTFSQSLKVALESLEKPARPGFKKRIEEKFDEIIQFRANNRGITGQSKKLVTEIAKLTADANSILLTFPLYPFSGTEESVLAMRRSIAFRTELYNPHRKNIHRLWCFTSEADARDWIVHFVRDSAQFVDPTHIPDDPRFQGDDGALQFVIEEAEKLVNQGYLQVKLLQKRACLVHCCVVNPRGVGDLNGYIWFYDKLGKVSDMHLLENHYLRGLGSWLNEIYEDVPETVKATLDLTSYRSAILENRN